MLIIAATVLDLATGRHCSTGGRIDTGPVGRRRIHANWRRLVSQPQVLECVGSKTSQSRRTQFGLMEEGEDFFLQTLAQLSRVCKFLSLSLREPSARGCNCMRKSIHNCARRLLGRPVICLLRSRPPPQPAQLVMRLSGANTNKRRAWKFISILQFHFMLFLLSCPFDENKTLTQLGQASVFTSRALPIALTDNL